MLAALGLAVQLTGCGKSLDARLESYLTALAAAQSAQPTAISAPRLEPYPDRGGLRVELPDVRVGFLDFLGLDRRCGLGTLVAGRNSALGMVMPASQRLVYEQSLLIELHDCLGRLRAEAGDAGMIAEIAALLQRKSQELPRVFWNATLAGPEFETMFSLSKARQLDVDALPRAGAATAEALDFLTRSFGNLGAEGRPLDSSALESHLHNLALEGFGGSLLATAAALINTLEPASRLLSRSGAAAACAELTALYRAQMTGWLQPLSAALTAAATDFLSQIDRLALLPRMASGAVPVADTVAEFQRYRSAYLDARDGIWRRFQRALREHRDAWRNRLDGCATSAGNETRARVPGLLLLQQGYQRLGAFHGI